MLLISIFIFFSFSLILFFVIKKGIGVFFSNPIVLGVFFYAIIHLVLPLMQINSNYYRYQSNYTKTTIVLSILAVLISQLIFITTFSRFKINYRKVFEKIDISEKKITKMMRINIIFFIIGAYFSYKNIHVILSAGVSEYLKDRISFGQGKGIQLLLPHWTYASAFIFIFLFFTSKNKKTKRINLFFSLISSLISFSYYILNSNRNSIFLMILLLGGAWLINNKKLNVKINSKQAKRIITLLFIGSLAVTMFFNIGKKRYDVYAQTHKEFKYSMVKALNGAFGNHENILWLMSHKHKKLFGQTYIASITNFIPRSIWKNKPLGAGPKLKNFIYPGSYVAGGKKNSSLTTGFFTELNMNFGLIGMLVFPFFIAVLFGFIFKSLNKSKKLIIKMLSFFTAILFFSQFYYAEFLGFFSRYIISIIPFIIIYIFVSIKFTFKKTIVK